MGVVVTKINTLRNESKVFQGDEEKNWKGKSGTDINDMCKSPVLSNLEKTKTNAQCMEKIIKYVNNLNSEIASINKIDEEIAFCRERINAYNSMSSIKRAAILGYDTQYYAKIQTLETKRKSHVEKIKQYENSINIATAKIV